MVWASQGPPPSAWLRLLGVPTVQAEEAAAAVVVVVVAIIMLRTKGTPSDARELQTPFEGVRAIMKRIATSRRKSQRPPPLLLLRLVNSERKILRIRCCCFLFLTENCFFSFSFSFWFVSE